MSLDRAQFDKNVGNARLRVLCGLMAETPHGYALVNAAQEAGFPTRWDDPRSAPCDPNCSDYGEIGKLAAGAVLKQMMHEAPPTSVSEYTLLAQQASREGLTVAEVVFDELGKHGIELSGKTYGRFHTHALPRAAVRPAASMFPAPVYAPRSSVRH